VCTGERRATRGGGGGGGGERLAAYRSRLRFSRGERVGAGRGRTTGRRLARRQTAKTYGGNVLKNERGRGVPTYVLD